jgi:hypothetical protein
MANWDDLFSGGFTDTSIDPLQNIASGVTGDIFTPAAPAANEKIRITGLWAGAAQAGITIEFGGVERLSLSTIGTAINTPNTGEFTIGAATTMCNYIEGGIGESLVIKKNVGNTAAAISVLIKYGM